MEKTFVKPENLADAACRDCGEKYDTPHKEGCSRARYKPNSDKRKKVLVKCEDVDF